MLVWSDPEPDAVGVPRGVVTNAQHVLVQLTRLPTTVAHAMSTGTFGVSPACCSVVIALIVGATFAGQSICGFGASVPFVTLNLKVEPVAHGNGDCWMFIYMKVIASAIWIVCSPTGPAARITTSAVPRVQFAVSAPT